MDNFYRMLVTIAFWLGLVSFVLALLMMLIGKAFLFGLTPGGIVHGGQALFLLAVAGYCTHKFVQRP